LIQRGIQNVQLMQLWEYVNREENGIKRRQALAFYKNGDYNIARQLLEELLNNNFEVLSTRMHLARLAIITDNFLEASQHTKEAWNLRKEAKNYVLGRILWFKIALAYLAKFSVEKYLGQLKTVLQNKDAFMEWAMQPVLDHIKAQITTRQYAFLSALVAAMSEQANHEKLNDFAEWRDAKPEEIE